MKTCSTCGETRPEESFGLRSDRPGKRRGVCKECIRDKYHAQERKYKRYGITKAQYDEMLDTQGDRCAICRRVATEALAIDHDHSCCSGNKSCGDCVRGLLCKNCNMAIGLLADSVEVLQGAIAYLKPK